VRQKTTLPFAFFLLFPAVVFSQRLFMAVRLNLAGKIVGESDYKSGGFRYYRIEDANFARAINRTDRINTAFIMKKSNFDATAGCIKFND
jgi:hypothetical protein